MRKKKYKQNYRKFKRGLLEKLAETLDLPKVQLAGRLSGSRKVSKKNAKILTEKFKEIGIDVPEKYWLGEVRSELRGLIIEWYEDNK